jgi:hypothetical protein
VNVEPPVVYPGKPEDFNFDSDSNDELPHPEPVKRDAPIRHRGGPIMRGTINTYVILYGNWMNSTHTNNVRAMTEDFLSGIGNSSWYLVNTEYYDDNGYISGQSSYISMTGFNTIDYRYGDSLSAQDIFSITKDAITSGNLPFDSHGVYFVLTSADVSQHSSNNRSFCSGSSGFCGWHSVGSMALHGVSKNIKFSFVGDPTNCRMCDTQRTSPNGDWAADAMVSVIAHELAETATDPEFNAWTDDEGYENADKCAWRYGDVKYL